MLGVRCYGLWCFGCSMGTNLLGGATCCILFCLGVAIDINKMYIFL